jgi:hypothetical protein
MQRQNNIDHVSGILQLSSDKSSISLERPKGIKWD